jgi:hypothetical protein
MHDPIVVIAVPCFDAEGVRMCTDRGPLFDARIGDRVIVERTSQPLLDACRVLITEGVDAKARVVMRHEGATADALRARVGVAGGLTVTEQNDGKAPPRFKTWRPHPRAGISSPASSPIAPNENLVGDIGSDADAL